MLIRDDRLYLSLASISKVCLAHWVDSGIEKHRYNTCRRYEMKLSQAKILISSEYQSDIPLATRNHHSIKSRLYKDFSDASLHFDTFDVIQVLPSDCDSLTKDSQELDMQPPKVLDATNSRKRIQHRVKPSTSQYSTHSDTSNH